MNKIKTFIKDFNLQGVKYLIVLVIIGICFLGHVKYELNKVEKILVTLDTTVANNRQRISKNKSTIHINTEKLDSIVSYLEKHHTVLERMYIMDSIKNVKK